MDAVFCCRIKHRVLLAFALLLSVVAASGCDWFFPSSTAQGLAQGWSDAERSFFYWTSQGSRLIRRDWFLNLERDDSQDLFLADGLKRFGYIPGEQGPPNPDRLPVGFVVDREAGAGRDWIGPNCAACHTAEIAHGGRTYRIEGAPASADLYEFLAKLDLAIRKAATDDAAFGRFAVKVLGANDTPANRDTLRNDADPRKGIRAYSTAFSKFMVQSTPTAPLKWGPARADAFGMIFNRVTSIDLGIDSNSKFPDAPVSYPFLWGTSWHKWTQWNAAIENDAPIAGPVLRLSRNVGQVLGVFGTLDFTSGPPYRSSANRPNLWVHEELVKKLTAPSWPAEFGVPDAGKVSVGRGLYSSKGCEGCHELVTGNQLRTARVEQVRQSLVGTDEAMTKMAATRTAATGILQGRRMNPVLGSSALIRSDELVHELLGHAVIGVLLDLGGPSSPATASITPSQLPPALFNPPAVAAQYYKARPLNGIWATGPYLHNGSVRTLYQMLLPPAQREVEFFVGSREFDPVDVGFKNVEVMVNSKLDTTLPGNRNIGHPFGTDLSDDDRRALIAFLKTL